MYTPHKANRESESGKVAFIIAGMAIYVQACHLQNQQARAGLLSYLIAGTDAGQTGSPAGKQPGGGTTGQGAGSSGKNGDDDAGEETNLGSSLVTNTGQVATKSDVTGAGNTEQPRKENDAAKEITEEDFAATSPGGTGESRIIGGVNPEDDEIDWNDAVDEGTKDADAATG
jgi:hypothetical protein